MVAALGWQPGWAASPPVQASPDSLSCHLTPGHAAPPPAPCHHNQGTGACPTRLLTAGPVEGEAVAASRAHPASSLHGRPRPPWAWHPLLHSDPTKAWHTEHWPSWTQTRGVRGAQRRGGRGLLVPPCQATPAPSRPPGRRGAWPGCYCGRSADCRRGRREKESINLNLIHDDLGLLLSKLI